LRNEILRKRIIRLIAISYAINEYDLYLIDEKIGDLEQLLTLIENNELKTIQ